MKKIFTLQHIFCCLLLMAATESMAQNLTDEAALKAKILKSISRAGISPSYLKEAHIASAYKEKQTGIEHIYLQQTCKGIEVYNQLISLAFKDDKLLYASGKFINGIEKKAGSPLPSLPAQEAVLKAAAHLNLTALLKDLQAKTNSFDLNKKIIFSPAGIAKRDIETRLYWTADSIGKLHLAWNVNIDVINKPDWWNVRVDALSGNIVQKDNWTVYEDEAQHAANGKAGKPIPSSSAADKDFRFMAPPGGVNSATYNVIPFPADNKNVQDFTPVTNPWLAAGVGNNATTYGWQYDGATDYTITRGNNVYAYEDTAAVNKPGKTASSVTPLPDLQFTAAPDFTKQPYDSLNQTVAITNLFYWNNLMHDVMYQYGFDEISGNFQADNMLRGGVGNDYVLAEAQDGSGISNANFSTPVDGRSGRMQMYLWNAAPNLTINTPDDVAGSYTSIESAFNSNSQLINVGPVTGKVVYYNTADSTGCFALSNTSSLPLKGRIALMYRGGCNFNVKVKNAQNAGATAVIMVNNAGAPVPWGSNDSTITIPSVMIATDDGAIISAPIRAGDSVSATMLNNGILLDGDLDNGIICHEYGHGVSNRLTGGPANASCLFNGEEAGEGWSDYQGIMMTTDWATETLTDGAKPRGVGTYAYGEGYTGVGIRRYPYSTDLKINPLTYANLPGNTEVHAIGEIWCEALWDMTWNIIQQEGKIEPNLYNAASSGGNTIALQLVLEGMRLQTCSPGFLDARDAILAADSILYGYKHKCAIWNAFARRGMGMSAKEGSPNSAADGTAAFDVPGVLLTKVSDPLLVKGQFEKTITATCGCNVPAGNYTLRDTIPAGFTYVSSNGGSASGNVVSFPLSFGSPLEVKTVSLTLSAPTGCNIDTLVFDDRDAHTTGGFASTTTAGPGGWSTDTSKFYSPTHSWYAPDADTISQYILTSGSFIPTDSLSVFSFWHYIATEYGFDGGVVELQINNGAWTDASPYFLKNGYNTVIDATKDSASGTNFPKTVAFAGTPFSVFSQSLVNLSSFRGSSVKVRFRIRSDQYSGVDGWYVDDITVASGCGGFEKIGLYSDSGKLADSYLIPVYSTPSALPVTLIGFNAEAKGASALLTWETASEINMKEYAIETSKDGISYNVIGRAAAKGGSRNTYTWRDLNPYSGWNYYRIKLVNADGSFTYSPARSVLFTGKGLIAVRPNPASSSATIYIDKDIQVSYISVTDMQGKLIKQVNAKNTGSTYTLATGSLASGTYLIKVVPVEGSPVTVKLVVQH